MKNKVYSLNEFYELFFINGSGSVDIEAFEAEA
jgi:hypothetical protein